MAEKNLQWLTPFKKQCYVTLGVSLNMAQMGLVMGFSTILLPQLRRPNSAIRIDDNSGSWLAAIPGISLLIGNLTIPSIMGKYGRKVANLTSLVCGIIGWICIVLAPNVSLLLAARCIQGIAMGMVSSLGPVLIGEYTSPKNRGAFLMVISVTISIGVLAIHSMGSYLTWQTAALICIAVTVLDLIIVASSPESPCWLADQGRYDECKAVYRWLRGDTEEDELEKMINSSMIVRKAKEEENDTKLTVMIKLRNNVSMVGQTIKKSEFFKPIIIMVHIYAMGQWSGVNILASYAVDMIHNIVGTNVDVSLLIISLDTQRIISNALALIIIKKLKRKTVLFITISLNIVALLVVGVYVYAKINDILPYDNKYIGIALIHFHTFTIATGALPMSFILAGELFPLQFKSMAGGISAVFFSLNMFVSVKTVPFLITSIGFYGTYFLYVGLMVYLLIVAGVMIPETKDRTLQDIEEEFRGKKKLEPVVEKFTSDPDRYI